MVRHRQGRPGRLATQLATEKVQDKLMKKLGDFLNRD